MDIQLKLKKMKRVLQIITLGLIVILSSCSNKNLMKYYYPINKEPEVKIYKYIDSKNNKPGVYWKTITDPIQRTILTESYDSEFNLFNTFEEKIDNNKAELLKFIEYENGAEIIATIKMNEVYNSNKSKSYSYAVEYTNKYGKMRFEKKRQFIKFEKIKIQGKQYTTAKFKDEYVINVFDQKDKFEFIQIAYYAKGIGMVKYERSIPSGEIETLDLDKILTEEEFKKLKKL